MSTKQLQELPFDYPQCRQQVQELRDLLASKVELSESSDVLPFFAARPQMAALFGMFNPKIAWANRFRMEFDIYGDYRCDLAVGEWERRAYCFVEFEDAQPSSIFQKRKSKATREWGQRFDHGYSQIIDWCHKLDGLTPGNDLLARFGYYEITFEAILVIGRETHLAPAEKQRLIWRADKVTVNAKKVLCMTFDELLGQFETRLATLAAVEATAPRKPSGKGSRRTAARDASPTDRSQNPKR